MRIILKTLKKLWTPLGYLLALLDRPLSWLQSQFESRLPGIVDAGYRALSWLHRTLAAGLIWLFTGICRLQSRARIELKFALGFTILFCISLWLALLAPDWLRDWMAYAGMAAEHQAVLAEAGVMDAYTALCRFAAVVAVLCASSIVLSLVRQRVSLWIMKAAWAAFAVMWIQLLILLRSALSILNSADHQTFDSSRCNEILISVGGIWIPLTIIPLLVLLALALRVTHETYSGQSAAPLVGDRIVASLKTGGRDPRYRTSSYWAASLFVLLILAPFILHGCHRMEPYGLVKGSGTDAVAQVVKPLKKKIKKKKLIVNAWSPYIFDQMEIDDTEIMDEIEDWTDNEWVAKTGEGKLGKGGGTTGGWPQGMANAKVRFIRLKYNGGDWDQDMGKGADYNLLLEFREITGFQIAENTEAINISDLRRFPKDHAPPFVFLTGMRGLSLTSQEIKTLRWYCEQEGGCLFIDNGGGNFDGAVRSVLRRVFPDSPLRDIANDDAVFQAPFLFSNGAPPLWHHSGMRAQGVRHNGRWVVFYHQGDVNDAWKDGHSGCAPEIAKQAYHLGVNVMYYCFNQYYRIHFEK